MMKRVEVNDAGAMDTLATDYYHGVHGLQQDRVKAIDLFTKAAKLGSSEAHCNLAIHYHTGGDFKRAIFHYKVAAMVGHEVARRSLGNLELKSGINERAIKHWMIAASAGSYLAMHNLL
jgi:TPR repeat protein